MSFGNHLRDNQEWHRRAAEVADVGSVIWCGTSGGSSNAYTATPAVAVDSYRDGQRFQFLANHTNTGAATLNISARGAQDIKTPDNSALSAGDIQTDDLVTVRWDTSLDDFVMLSETGGSTGAYYWGGTSGGTGNNYTVTINSNITALYTGLVIRFAADKTNTDTVTINVNALGNRTAITHTGSNAQNMYPHDIVTGRIIEAVYVSPNWEIINNGRSTDTGHDLTITSAGGSSATATAIDGFCNVITTHTAGQGVRISLPTGGSYTNEDLKGRMWWVLNASGTATLNVYPPTTFAWNGGGSNVPFVLGNTDCALCTSTGSHMLYVLV